MVRALQPQMTSAHVDVAEVGTGGVGLLDSVRGYDRLILVDAIVTGAAPGTLHLLEGSDVARASHLGPGHDADLPTVLALGKQLMGRNMPKDVVVVAIEASDVVSVSTDLTPEVEAAISGAVARIKEICSEGFSNAV